MLKAEELRIGNWVETKGNNRPFQWKLSDFVDSYNDHNAHEYYNHVIPIPLTEEWVEKFGFEEGVSLPESLLSSYTKDSPDGIWTYQIENHPSFKAGYIFFIDIYGVSAPPSVKIKYVHQLQNLYFALAEEELKC